QAELLMDHRDAGLACGQRVSGNVGLAGQLEPAAVGGERTGQDLHQRALAGTVLAHQRVHFSRQDFQIHAAERSHRAERLADMLHAQERTQCSHGRRSGDKIALVAGSFMLSRVTSCTPVSTRAPTVLPPSLSTAAWTASSPMRNGFCSTKPFSSPRPSASTNLSLLSKPTNFTCPARFASCSART